MHVLLGPGHFRNVDQAFDARLDFHECTVIGDVRDLAGNLGAERILRADGVPRIRLELLHAERDTMGFLVDADDLHLDRLADGEQFRRMVDAAPGHVGDMQQAVDAAQIHERTVIGDVLDGTVNDLAFFEVLHDFRTLFRTRFFKNRTARDNDVAAALVHLEDFERLGNVHERGDIADRADIDLAARQEGGGAIEIDGEAALDDVENGAFDAFALGEFLFKLDPRFFAAGFFARQHGFAQSVFDALDIDVDHGTRLQRAVLGLSAKFLDGHAAFNLQTGVDDDHVFFNGNDAAFDNRTFNEVGCGKGFFEKRGEIFARRVGFGHRFSWMA